MAKLAVALLTTLSGVEALRKRSRGTCGAMGSNVSADGPGSQIVNGENAPRCAWKWQIGLKDPGSNRPFCGGMLIAPEWVLTAAHCVDGPAFEVVAGDWIWSLPGPFTKQRKKTVQVISHPGYDDSSMANDLALVKLDSPMKDTGCVGSVCLPEAGQDVPPGTKCWITGFGTLRSGGKQPQILQQAEVTTMSNEKCVKDYAYTSSQIDETMMCAQGRSESGHIIDGCQGDSGGPLVCEVDGRFTLYGATSWGFGCARWNYPGVWARVHHSLDWIYDTMA